MSDGYHAISGLLKKRGEMLANMADLREQIAVLSNDLESIERVARQQCPGKFEKWRMLDPSPLPSARCGVPQLVSSVDPMVCGIGLW